MARIFEKSFNWKKIIDLDKVIKDIYLKDDNYWKYIEEKNFLSVYRFTIKNNKAYLSFLKSNGINPDKIKTIKDFKNLPFTSKKEFINKYNYFELINSNDIKMPKTIHSTSGSTGEPTYFFRNINSDLIRAIILELFLRNNKLTITEPTLFIVTFGMGVWSAGMGIYTASYLINNFNNFPISVITPGVNKLETLKILKKLAPNFKNLILAGYPPFLKDVIDEYIDEGLNFKKFNSIRFIFTGEILPESLRDYIVKKSQVKNLFRDTMNTYGTSEVGATAIETPLTILIRRLAIDNKKLFKDLFGNFYTVPTLAQYIPYFVQFECVNDELVITHNGVIPLVRYRIGDRGKIFTFTQIKEILRDYNIDLFKEARKYNIEDCISQLPFVCVYERTDFARTLFGIVIYPEYIRDALLDKSISKYLTGKFVMMTKYSKNKRNQFLEINLELRKNVVINKNVENIILKKIVDGLRKRSSEYRELSNNIKERAYPKLKFWPYEHPLYFSVKSKHKWVI